MEAGTLDAPEGLDECEQREWERITRLLADEGMLGRADRAMLLAYCISWGRWWRSHRKVAETGGEVVKSPSGFPIQNPWLSVSNHALRQMSQIGAQFGLSPATRPRARRAAKRPVQPEKP